LASRYSRNTERVKVLRHNRCDENHSPELFTGSGWCETISGHEAESIRPSKTGEKVMANYATVSELIDNLKRADNLDAPIIYQYYLAEHFNVSEEVFAEVARDFDSLVPCSDSYEVISKEIESKKEGSNV
jgi:hypothetical protein